MQSFFHMQKDIDGAWKKSTPEISKQRIYGFYTCTKYEYTQAFESNLQNHARCHLPTELWWQWPWWKDEDDDDDNDKNGDDGSYVLIDVPHH